MTKTNTKKATTSVTTNVTSNTVITKDNIGTINPILTFTNKGRLATANSNRASGGGGVSVDDDILAFQQAKEELLKRRGAR